MFVNSCLALCKNLLFLFVEQYLYLCFLVSLLNGSHRSFSKKSLRSFGHWRRRQTDRQVFSLRVMDMYSVSFTQHVLECGVIVVGVLGKPLLGERQRGQELCVGLGVSLFEVVGVGLITLWGSRSRQESPYPFRRSAQARYERARGCAGDKGWMRRWGSWREWRTQGQSWAAHFMRGWDDMRNTLEPCDVVCVIHECADANRIRLDRRSDWTHAHVKCRVSCGLYGSRSRFWLSRCHWCLARFHHADAIPLMVKLSLVPRRRCQVQSSFLLNFVVQLCTFSQSVFCERQFHL